MSNSLVQEYSSEMSLRIISTHWGWFEWFEIDNITSVFATHFSLFIGQVDRGQVKVTEGDLNAILLLDGMTLDIDKKSSN